MQFNLNILYIIKMKTTQYFSDGIFVIPITTANTISLSFVELIKDITASCIKLAHVL